MVLIEQELPGWSEFLCESISDVRGSHGTHIMYYNIDSSSIEGSFSSAIRQFNPLLGQDMHPAAVLPASDARYSTLVA